MPAYVGMHACGNDTQITLPHISPPSIHDTHTHISLPPSPHSVSWLVVVANDQEWRASNSIRLKNLKRATPELVMHIDEVPAFLAGQVNSKGGGGVNSGMLSTRREARGVEEEGHARGEEEGRRGWRTRSGVARG